MTASLKAEIDDCYFPYKVSWILPYNFQREKISAICCLILLFWKKYNHVVFQGVLFL